MGRVASPALKAYSGRSVPQCVGANGRLSTQISEANNPLLAPSLPLLTAATNVPIGAQAGVREWPPAEAVVMVIMWEDRRTCAGLLGYRAVTASGVRKIHQSRLEFCIVQNNRTRGARCIAQSGAFQ
jgi:hypothetical protein